MARFEMSLRLEIDDVEEAVTILQALKSVKLEPMYGAKDVRPPSAEDASYQQAQVRKAEEEDVQVEQGEPEKPARRAAKPKATAASVTDAPTDTQDQTASTQSESSQPSDVSGKDDPFAQQIRQAQREVDAEAAKQPSAITIADLRAAASAFIELPNQSANTLSALIMNLAAVPNLGGLKEDQYQIVYDALVQAKAA